MVSNLNDALSAAVQCLTKGGIIAYPTEAVFGLGCDPDNDVALRHLLELKQRPAHKGLILVAASLEQLQPYLEPLADDVLQKLRASWPGPVTWLCPVKESVSTFLRGEHATLAVRVSAHPLVQHLCQLYGKPIVSTSANISNGSPATTADEVRRIFGAGPVLIVPGQVGGDPRPTEIRDALTDAIIRPA